MRLMLLLLRDEVVEGEGLIGRRSVGGADTEAIGVTVDVVLGLAGA